MEGGSERERRWGEVEISGGGGIREGGREREKVKRSGDGGGSEWKRRWGGVEVCGKGRNTHVREGGSERERGWGGVEVVWGMRNEGGGGMEWGIEREREKERERQGEG